MDNLLRYLIKWNREIQKHGLHKWAEKHMFNKTKEAPTGVFYGKYMPVEPTHVLYSGSNECLNKLPKPINVTYDWG